MSKEMRQYIDKFRDFLKENSEEELNISDVMNSVLSELKQDLDDAKWAKRDKEINYENSQFFDGKIKGLEISIEKIENLIKYYS
jgi:hypothetical protein